MEEEAVISFLKAGVPFIPFELGGVGICLASLLIRQTPAMYSFTMPEEFMEVARVHVDMLKDDSTGSLSSLLLASANSSAQNLIFNLSPNETKNALRDPGISLTKVPNRMRASSAADRMLTRALTNERSVRRRLPEVGDERFYKPIKQSKEMSI